MPPAQSMSWFKAGSLLEAPWHEMEVPRSKKKGTVLQVGLDLFISKLCLPFYVCTVWRRDGKEDLNYRHVYLIDGDLSCVSQDIGD